MRYKQKKRQRQACCSGRTGDNDRARGVCREQQNTSAKT